MELAWHEQARPALRCAALRCPARPAVQQDKTRLPDFRLLASLWLRSGFASLSLVKLAPVVPSFLRGGQGWPPTRHCWLGAHSGDGTAGCLPLAPRRCNVFRGRPVTRSHLRHRHTLSGSVGSGLECLECPPHTTSQARRPTHGPATPLHSSVPLSLYAKYPDQYAGCIAHCVGTVCLPTPLSSHCPSSLSTYPLTVWRFPIGQAGALCHLPLSRARCALWGPMGSARHCQALLRLPAGRG